MKSIWENEVCQIKEVKENTDWDVIVVGGGIAGILCAYTLQKEGFNVLVLEANTIMSGQSGKTTAKITSLHGLKYADLIKQMKTENAKKYYEANEEAISLYKKIIKEENIDCDFKICDAYLYSTQKNALKKEIEALKKLKIDAIYTDQSELPFQIEEAIVFKHQAQFHPVKFAYALAKKLNIIEHTRVLKIKGHTLITDKQEFKAKRIVLCTHFPIKNIPGFYFLRMHQERSYVLALKSTSKMQNEYKDINPLGFSFRGFKEVILFGGEGHRCGENKDHVYANLIKEAKKLYPECEIETMWSAQDCMSHDVLPFIGKYSFFLKDVYVITGFNKWGMSTSMLASKIIKDLILEKENEYASLFTPQRFHLCAYKNFLIDVKESSINLILGLFQKKKCAHLGCKLHYNENEDSYDCICHGSRFNKEGKLLNSPTTKNLK